jgi:hypothetical protein
MSASRRDRAFVASLIFDLFKPHHMDLLVEAEIIPTKLGGYAGLSYAVSPIRR